MTARKEPPEVSRIFWKKSGMMMGRTLSSCRFTTYTLRYLGASTRRKCSASRFWVRVRSSFSFRPLS